MPASESTDWQEGVSLKFSRRRTAMTNDLLFDHLRGFGASCPRISPPLVPEAFYVQLHAMAALAMASVQAKKPNRCLLAGAGGIQVCTGD